MIDIRRIIGGLFVLYGVIVGIVGLLDSPAELRKADGVRINLWVGAGMAAFGALMLIWSVARPLPPQAERTDDDQPRAGHAGRDTGQP